VTFGDSRTEIHPHIGQSIGLAQGGPFARPELTSIVASLREEGLHGVPQSSWGPTLYRVLRYPF
jgi:predicted sugar kinase